MVKIACLLLVKGTEKKSILAFFLWYFSRFWAVLIIFISPPQITMSTAPVKPLTPVRLHPIRRNLTSTTTLKCQAMLTAVPSKHIIGCSTYNRCFEFKSWSQMRNPAFLSHRRRVSTVVASAGNMTAPSSWESWMPDKKAAATTLLLSDVIWPAAGKLTF